jgi:hypothetical protein
VEKIVKTRKDHECCACEKIIKRGEQAKYHESRGPKFNWDDEQIGIEYLHLYMHMHDCTKPDSCKAGEHVWIDEYTAETYPEDSTPTGNKMCENCYDIKPG